MESRISRVVALAGLLMASLAVIAVVGPERPRAYVYTVILWVAIAAAAISALALLASVTATPRRVVARDLRSWRRERHLDRDWQAAHYIGGEGLDRKSPFIGRACFVVALKPPRKLFPPTGLSMPVEGATVSCVVECRAGRFECDQAAPDPWGVRARWPEELLDRPRGGVAPGRYKLWWEIHAPGRAVIRHTEKLHFSERGNLLFGRIRRFRAKIGRILRHLGETP